ncbi:hypothetical protein C8P68_102412 [Mucilaginibacter yixingensis]|uniref:Uncharacterized protein n=1 Tax=Mucilaginibacter yixingensis TaxID=1295612 RepID=A0A2T5JCT3_9SPHI|nr:hypothetical protein [Mucilaginibacter yixingensis]PTQ99587.1 hypothetical protein C8P68_102412 [Mucilaginibacter yixingensis]
MNKKLVTPLITWLIFATLDIAFLIKSIELNQSWRMMAAVAGLLISAFFVVTATMQNRRELKPVRVKSRN